MPNQTSEFRIRLGKTLDSHGLPGDLAAEIEDRLTPVTYEKGAVIFLRGSPADLLFCLLKGLVKLYLPHGDGNRTLVDLARPGDFLGFVNEVNSKGCRQLLEAHALSKCSIGLFAREHLMQLLSKLDHQTTIGLLEHLNTHWARAFERYITFVGSSFRMRLETVLNSLGSRFGIDDMRGTLLVPELSHEDLAEMIGSSRPMVSKLLGDMMQEGLLVRAEKRHFILRAKGERAPAASEDLQRPVAANGACKRVADAPVPLSAMPGTKISKGFGLDHELISTERPLRSANGN
jgi:CRP-like cAMP-binding protein